MEWYRGVHWGCTHENGIWWSERPLWCIGWRGHYALYVAVWHLRMQLMVACPREA